MKTNKLGFDKFFYTSAQPFIDQGFEIARISEVNKSNYIIKDEEAEIPAELTGKLLFNADSPLHIPTVGDWVVVQYFDDKTLGIIHEILPRRTLLKRKDASKKVEFQLIAANIDAAFIMQALDENFNLNRLERYLVMVNESNIQPVILLSKCDLKSPEELVEVKSSIQRLNEKYTVIMFSNVSNEGLLDITGFLKPQQTYCLLGSSGVGKTTLLNKLMEAEVFETAEVREKDHKGKHTTTKRQLTILENGSIFIDTPGMRELANFSIDKGLAETFDEISEFANHCRFSDCTHRHENGCAVLNALQNGEIDEDRYRNFLKIQKEADFYAMSYLDKKKRDKQLGKILKDFKKNHRKK